MRYLTVVAFTAGCGFVVGTFDSGQVSGTRLKLVYFDFDGTRSISAIYDSARNETCEVKLWSDGRLHCTPTPAEQVVYADATCTHKVALTSNDPCLVPEYLVEHDYSDCRSPVSHLYERGKRVSITQYWYQTSQGCLGPVPTRQRQAYAVGRAVEPSSLVPIDRGLFAGQGRLQRQFLTSPDGLRMLSGQLRDTELNLECSLVGNLGSSAGVCTPLHDAPISYFQDATCSTPVAATRNDCDAPQVAVKMDSCAAPDTYFALGAPLPSDSIYFGTPQACWASAAPADHTYFSVGEELTLATPSRTPTSEGRRIESIRFALEGAGVFDRPLYDTRTATECLPFKLADGNAYCLPFGGRWSTYYSDPRCTAAVDVITVYRGPETCGPPHIPAYALKERHDPTCANSHEARPVTERHEGQLYESLVGNCIQHVVAENYLEYDLGPPIPLDDLASGALVTDW